MVNIRRGKSRLRVTQKSFTEIYEPMGYTVIGGSKKEKENDSDFDFPDFEENTQDNKTDVDSIPISDMNAEQLKEYAIKHSIDLKGTKSVSEARRVVQKHIRESKK